MGGDGFHPTNRFSHCLADQGMTSKVQAAEMVKAMRAIPAMVMETMRAMLAMVVVMVGERKRLVTLSNSYKHLGI